ncbi:MAG TPA: response regulator [Phenylobacterium sp.]|nr:response regulator [Phenylobacterium sp.]
MDQRLANQRPVIFVVDDDAAVRRALEFSLDLEGFEVETFESGEALLLRDPPTFPGCLVIDERLPGISGLETLRQLRSRRVDLPALLVTSHPKPLFRVQASAFGAPILEKPLLGETLAAAIRTEIAAAAAERA